MQKKNTVNAGSLVDLGNSKRLAAMRKSTESSAMREGPLHTKNNALLNSKECDIKQARKLIKQVITDIKSAYPIGRQNSFFRLRYISEEQLQQLSLQEVFTLLKIKRTLPKYIMQVKFADGSKVR